MNFFDALFATPLLQHALIAGGLAGICCACLSPLTVIKRMAFVGDGMAHAAFGGIGLSLFLLSHARFDSIEVQLGTLAFALVLGVFIARATSWKKEQGALREDSAIGVAFSASMALGALLIALRQQRTPGYVPTMDSFLFGSLMTVSPADVAILSIVTVLVLGATILLKKEMLFYAFDPKLAELSGVNSGLIHYLFMLLLVLTVTVSARVVGIVLVSASLILPGTVALRRCRRLAPAMAFAAVLGFVSFELGIYLSYVWNVPPGSTIVLIQFLCFAVSMLFPGKDERDPQESFEPKPSA